MRKLLIGAGFGGVDRVVKGKVAEWSDCFLESQDLVKGKIIYNKGQMPLYRAAFLVESGVKVVLMEEGGKNYHPLILFNDAQVPAVVGIGKVDLEGKNVTVDAGEGKIYKGEIQPKKKRGREVKIPKTKTKVYVNVGYPTAIESAAKTGADGIGLLRIEFAAVRTLSRILNKELFKGTTVKEAIASSNEADVIYAIAKHKDLRGYLKRDLKDTITNAVDHFGEKEIIVRTIDIARKANEPMGNRGIRRCIAEGGHTIKLLAEAIKECLEQKRGNYNIGIILPLVSHYSQIRTALDIFLATGLKLMQNAVRDRLAIRYGWEIEQPAASENNEIWLEAFRAEYGHPPHFIGIGTNDLTQFTIALGRDVYTKETNLRVRNYLKGLYDESDFSVIKQIYEVSRQCRKVGTRLFLLGEAAANPDYAQLMLSFGIIPSVGISNVKRVKLMASKFEKERNSKEVIRKYIERICNQYSSKARSDIKFKLLQIFDVE
jgi:pyruvate,water dikinase